MNTGQDLIDFINSNDWIKCQQDYARMRGIALIPENEDEIDNIKLPVASFGTKEDKYLYWHCPLEFVREYLETQCGYKKRTGSLNYFGNIDYGIIFWNCVISSIFLNSFNRHCNTQ